MDGVMVGRYRWEDQRAEDDITYARAHNLPIQLACTYTGRVIELDKAVFLRVGRANMAATTETEDRQVKYGIVKERAESETTEERDANPWSPLLYPPLSSLLHVDCIRPTFFIPYITLYLVPI